MSMLRETKLRRRVFPTVRLFRIVSPTKWTRKHGNQFRIRWRDQAE
jgi:hypothetical protein